jgi:hypothetical protein
MSGIVNAQTYYPEWKYTKLTLDSNAGSTATLDNKFVGGEMEILAVSSDNDTVKTSGGSFTVKQYYRAPNSSTILDTIPIAGYRIDTIATDAGVLTFSISNIGSAGKASFILRPMALDKIIFTKGADHHLDAPDNVITLYIRQRALVRTR